MSAEESEEKDFWDILGLTNLTEEEYLARVLGPKYLPTKMVIPLTLVYVIIFVTGVVGNIATCTVIIKNSSMQSATNYYLFSLAISDLTLLILGLPNELSIFWQQYPWVLGVSLCKIRAYVSEMSSYVSVLTIVAFSMERYLAICHPLRVYAVSGMKRPVRFILAAWTIALVAAIPFAVYTAVNYVEYPPETGNYSADSAICAMLLPDMPNFPLYELSCIVFFLLPMLVILVVYTRMGLMIWSSAHSSLNPVIQGSVHRDNRQVQSRKTVVRMLSAVVVMFFVCWAPFHAQRLLYVYAQDTDYYPDLNEWLYILSGCLYYFSTTVNPILYNLMSSRYRDAFKRTLCCRTRIRTKLWYPLARGTAYRYTVVRAKEILRRSTRCEEQNDGDAKNPGNGLLSVEITTKVAEEQTSKRKLQVGYQSSNESSVSRNRTEESVSTASSAL
ncbi:neuropeptides capa receptor isoform X2 [Orussus abietinus]|uniref:neuropeptides capa receptor isoform X2 n=1 Tax=Orussus abietinus TaxID=222816 RepID=UPI0006254CD7|nr:neuropeptides capa receptor isoform X2 [Orussus abietinus]